MEKEHTSEPINDSVDTRVGGKVGLVKVSDVAEIVLCNVGLLSGDVLQEKSCHHQL